MTRKNAIRTVLALMFLAASFGLAAQNNPTQPPNVCMESPEFNQWDFWLGNWKVYTNNEDATQIGTNSITKHYNNCLIKEEWVDANGNGGFSMNFYHPIDKHWRQVWVSNGFFIDYAGGLNDEGQMVLEGESDVYSSGSTTGFRGIWTPQENGDVIQRFETLDAESGEWNVVFEARYVKE